MKRRLFRSPVVLGWPESLSIGGLVRPAIVFALLAVQVLLDIRPVKGDEAEQKRRNELLAQSVPRNRRLREMLASVDLHQANGRAAEALKTVQWVLDQPHDVLAFGQTSSEPPLSVKSLAETKLRSFPPEWRKQYERTYGLEARQILEDAQERDDDHLAWEVIRRFRQTTAGDEASLWLAKRWIDQGELDSALHLVFPREALGESLGDQSTPRLKLVRWLALATGQGAILQAVNRELEDRSETVPDIRVPTVDGLRPHQAAEKLTPLAAAADRLLLKDAVPVLRPRWSVSLVGHGSSPHLPQVLDAWKSQLQETSLVPVITNVPLVLRNQVIVRDYEGVRGIDLHSGQPLWMFPCESSISGWIDQASRQQRGDFDVGGSLPPEMLQWWISNNSQLAWLSSDGIRVYLVDSLHHPAQRVGNKRDQFQARGTEPQKTEDVNRLVALEIPTANTPGMNAQARVAWSYGRSLQHTEPTPQDRYFFGPPLPHAGRLLSIAEMDREIRLLMLNPETGAILWEQPLAAVDRAAVNDGERAFTASMPIVAGELLICPTQAGVLTAVESATGQLRWSFFDGDLPPDQNNRPRQVIVSRGRPGFVPRTLVKGNRVLHLPSYSTMIHCLDRETGRGIWSVPRRRASTIAAATNEVVMLLENQECRGLSLADGREIWSLPVSPIVGTGLELGGEYLVPLEQGRYVAIDVATGQKRSWQPPRPHISLGNFAAVGDTVLSVGPDRVTAFPRAGLVRADLAAAPPQGQEFSQSLLKIELYMAAGDFAAAERDLEDALQADLSRDVRSDLNSLLRELLYQQLDAGAGKTESLLSRLGELAATPAEQGRYLARLARWSVDVKNLPEARRALLSLQQLPVDVTFPSASDPTWKQSSSACSRQLLLALQPEFPEFVSEMKQQILVTLPPLNAGRPSMHPWRFALRVCAEDPDAGPVRETLARRLMGQGQSHPAELLWLQNRRMSEVRLAADAAAGLTQLWAAAGWGRDAVEPLNQLTQEFSQVELSSRITGSDFVTRHDASGDLRRWQQRMSLPRGEVMAASIRPLGSVELPAPETLSVGKGAETSDPRSSVRYGEFARKLSAAESGAADLLIRARGNQSALVVVDRSTSQIVRTFSLPPRHSHPWMGSSSFLMHFLPLGVPGELRGYSLLQMAEDAPAWSLRPPELDGRRVAPSVGPGGPAFVVFQAQTSLFVCDPWDGALLWQRSDLEPASGLYSEPATGISGDESCLVVFAADRAGYTVYETFSGQKLRTGRLDLEPRQMRRAVGRRIFSVVQQRGQWQARVWDPLSDRWDLQESLGERNFATLSLGTPEVAWMTADGKFRIYDIAQVRRVLDISIRAEEMEGLNSLRFLSDGDRYYVNLQRNMPTAQTREYNYPAGDTLVPSLHVRDDLYAIDKPSGQILWKRTVPSRTLLKLDPPGLPFLILLSRIRDRNDGNLQSLLVEVLDANTGELLSRQEQLPADRILNAEYDQVDQTLRLVGQRSDIQIHFTMQLPAEGN